MPKYELCFEGEATREYKFPRYRRYHNTIESAQETAYTVAEKLDRIHGALGKGTITACHNPILYGPGCGDSGITLKMYRD